MCLLSKREPRGQAGSLRQGPQAACQARCSRARYVHLHRFHGRVPCPSFPSPSFLSIPSPAAWWKRGIQSRQEAGPAPPKAGCFQPPERQVWTCLLVRQASLPLLSPQLNLKQALSSALSTQGRKECFRPKHWFLLQWSSGARDGALGTRRC